MTKRDRQRGLAITLSLTLAVLLARPLRGGTVMPTTDIDFQPLVADMALATMSGTLGADPTAMLNYGGTFDQTGWNGAFGGLYLNQTVSGTMGAIISGDPNWIVMGNTKSGNVNFPIDITLNQSNTNPALFSLGTNSKLGTDTWTGSVTETLFANSTISMLSGTLSRLRTDGEAFSYNVTITINLNDDSIVSAFINTASDKISFGNKGTLTALDVVGANFNGALALNVALVPEPASLVLLSIGILGVLGFARYAGRRAAA